MQPQYSREVIIFLIAANIIVAGAAVFFFLLLRIQYKRKRLYQKQLLQKEFKTREESFLQISRDLHDEIGSSLSGINMLSQLAQQQLQEQNTEAANHLLFKINTYTNEVIDKVSDMAWLLKPNEESLYILLEKIKTYGFTTAGSKNIRLQFTELPEAFGKELSIGQRKAIYLISKEAINNAVKYADCKNIDYKISLSGNKIILYIEDDGKGFAISESVQGNGLKNMQARAKEINAVFSIQSIPGKGTTLELTVE
jgi:signal transduction histidine kinase